MSWHNATQNGGHLLTDGIDVSSTDLVRPSYIWWGSSQGVYNYYRNTTTQRGRCQDTLKQIGKNTPNTGVDKAAQDDPVRHGQTNSNGHYTAVHNTQTNRIQSSRSTSSDRFILPVMVENINLFCRRSGRGNSIFLSSRPGLSNAGSNVSDRLVAMITCSHGSTDCCTNYMYSKHQRGHPLGLNNKNEIIVCC